MSFILAAISVQTVMYSFLGVLLLAAIAYVLWWGLDKWAPGEPFNKLLRGLIVLFVVVGLIHIILKLAGKPGLITW